MPLIVVLWIAAPQVHTLSIRMEETIASGLVFTTRQVFAATRALPIKGNENARQKGVKFVKNFFG
jgi:hypothetical protein